MNKPRPSAAFGGADPAVDAIKRTNGRLDDKALVEIFEVAMRSRIFEARLVRWAKEGGIPPLLHPGAGQEIAQLAALHVLRNSDPMLYAHRGLAYIIGRGVPLTAILADASGREGGTNNGKGGLMHTVDIARGVYGESGTLGGGFVIATGMGMAIKKQRRDDVIVHFFGDGTSNRGTFHESLNWAAVQKLPVIFICENNGWAVSVPTSVSTAVEDIASRAAGYGIPGVVVDGGDADEVAEAVAVAAERARAGEGPTLIEIKAVRLLGHFATDMQEYRADRDECQARDPMLALRRRLVEAGLLTEEQMAEMERRITTEVEDALDEVKAAPLVSGELAFTDLYS
nr:thiamine pyrophosphate-dependent dehydrogenase E1 component subunit alpha [Sphingomonas sp. Y57]